MKHSVPAMALALLAAPTLALPTLAQSAPVSSAPAQTGPSGPAPSVAGPDLSPISLPDALAQALATNPRLEVARSGVEAGRAQKRGARAEGRPQVEFNGSGQFQGPTRGGFGGGTLQPGRAAQIGVDASVPLYTGGRVKASKRRASAAEQAALARVDAEAQRLVLDVTEAYLSTLEAQQETALVAKQRQLNEERVRIGRVRLSAGVGVPLEVSQAEADLAETTQREIDAGARLRQSGATLNTLIGQPAETPLNLVSLPLAPGAKSETGGPATPTDPAVARAMALERPDLGALREDVRGADAGVDSARAQRRPLVALGTNLLRRFPETFLGSFAWSLGASLVQTIFDGGRTRAQVEAARAERHRVSAVLADAERLAEELVEQSRVGLEAAEQRLGFETARVAAAQEALTSARRRFEAGVSPHLEVTEAETVLARAETDSVTARFAVARARVRLAYAAGRAYPELVAPAQTVQTVKK